MSELQHTEGATVGAPFDRGALARRVGWSLVAIVAGLAVIVVWASNKAIDLTDEGYYLLLYARPESAPTSADWSQFYVLVDLLSGPFEPSVAGYRLAGLAATLATSLFFATSVLRFIAVRLPLLSRRLPDRRLFLSFVGLAGLLGYVWIPLTPGYNTVAAALVSVGAAATLHSLAQDNTARRLAWMALVGVVLPLLFFTKFPAAVLLVVSVVVFAGVVVGWRSAGALAGVVIGVGLVVGLIVAEDVGGGWFSFASLRASLDLAASNDAYSTGSVVSNSTLGLVEAAVRPLVESPLRVLALIVVFSGASVARLTIGRPDRARRWGGVLVSVGALYLIAEIPVASYTVDFFEPFGFVAAIPVSLAVMAFVGSWERTGALPELRPGPLGAEGRIGIWLVLGLVGLAVLPAVGTGNSIATNVMISAAPLGAATVILLVIITAGLPAAQGRALGAVAVMTLVMATQIVNGVVVDPYRTSNRFDANTSASGLVNGGGLSHDSASAGALSELAALVADTSFQPGDPVLTVGWIPGAAYLVDATVPGSIWIAPPQWEDQAAACVGLRDDADRVARTRLLLVHSDISAGLDSCLTDLIPGYPESVVEVGSVAYEIEYWNGAFSAPRITILEIGR